MTSYLKGLFENLMEGGEDAASAAMVVKVKGEQDRGEMTDRQTDRRQGVSAKQKHRVQLQAGGGVKRPFFSATLAFEIGRLALAPLLLRRSFGGSCWETAVTLAHADAATGGSVSRAHTLLWWFWTYDGA